jgi:hypothetical protein
MTKQNLYKELGMDEFIWGDCFMVQRTENEIDVINSIDNICIAENRNPLGENWNEISYTDCSELLLNAFIFDLAYTSGANMSTEKAEYFRDTVFSNFDEYSTKCYTNWYQNPWKSKNGASWNPITENTFDMAIVLVDRTKIVFTYFISED